MLEWVRRVRTTVTDIIARLPRGRPREYHLAAITGVAEDLILIGVDDYLDRFVERVWNECKKRNIKVPKAPLSTLLTQICRPIYLRARAEKAEKN